MEESNQIFCNFWQKTKEINLRPSCTKLETWNKWQKTGNTAKFWGGT